MKIIHTPPPNYRKIRKHFPDADFEKGVVFTYGNTCYCKNPLSADLAVHEEVHTKQQTSPRRWWKQYFKDPEFRLSQEIEAYQAQWEFIRKHVIDRNQKSRIRESIAATLSSALYGNVISFMDALRLLRR